MQRAEHPSRAAPNSRLIYLLRHGVAHGKERDWYVGNEIRIRRSGPLTFTGAIRARPTLPLRAAAPSATNFTTSIARRQDAQPPQPPQKEPKEVAANILNALPGNSTVSKLGILSAGSFLSVAAISNELYVVNEESIIMLSLLTIYWAIYNYAGPGVKSWAEGQSEKIKNILNAAREDHTNAVKARIDNVKDLSGVIDITKDLFAVSKVRRARRICGSPFALLTSTQETAELEAKAYELQQKADIAAEAKTVLDSWVRYEGQVKARQQKELAESVINKINKELDNPKVLDQILKQAVQDVESKSIFNQGFRRTSHR